MFVNAAQTAKLLGVSESTVRRLAKAGHLPSRRIPSVRRLIFNRAVVLRWITENCEPRPTTATPSRNRLYPDFPTMNRNE